MCRFGPIPVEMGTDMAEMATKTGRYGRFWPKQPPKQAKMGSGCHSSASCGLVGGKKNEKEEEDEKTQKEIDSVKKYMHFLQVGKSII